MPRFPGGSNLVDVAIFCDSATDPGQKWRSVTSDVLWENRINIRHGRLDESSDCPPASCSLTLKDLSGNYTRRNPLSPYYGFLGQNTPLRVRTTVLMEDFSTTGVDTWGTPSFGANGVWSHTVRGNVPTPSTADFDKGGGVGTIVIPNATNQRWGMTSLTDQFDDCDLEVTFSTGAASITGGTAVVSLTAHGLDESVPQNWYSASVGLMTDGSIKLGIGLAVDADAAAATAAAGVVMGLTYSQNTQYKARFSCQGYVMRAKVWLASAAEPAWQTSLTVTSWPDTQNDDIFSRVGIGASRATGNTNASFTVSFRNFYVRSQRFSGEISSIRKGRDGTGNFQFAAIEASGALRRLSQGVEPIQSALRQATPALPYLIAYWPMEEETDATQFTAATANTLPMTVQTTVMPQFASDSSYDASKPLPVFNASAFGAVLPNYDATIFGSTQVRFLCHIPTTGATTNSVVCRIWGTGTARLWQLIYTTASGGTWTLEAYNVSVNNVLSTVVHTGVDGDLDRISIELDQNGANVDWAVRRYTTKDSAVASSTGTLGGFTIGQATYMDFNQPNNQLVGTSVGHVTVQSNITSFTDLTTQQNAYQGELAGARITRLCSDAGVTVYVAPGTTEAMGVQSGDGFMGLLRECEKTDFGTLHDGRGQDTPILEYRPRASAYRQYPQMTLSMSGGHISQPFDPIDDDALLRNDVIAANKGGGEYNAVLSTGALSVLPPASGGSGRYKSQYDVNVAFDSQLNDIAGWWLALGTVDEYRFPGLTVDLGRTAVAGVTSTSSMSLYQATLNTFVDDRIDVTGMQISRIYDTVTLIVRGYSEVISQTDHYLTFNCSPYTPYRVTLLQPITFSSQNDYVGRLDARTSVIDTAMSSSDTTLTLRSQSERWAALTGNPLYDNAYWLKVAGEKMLVTAVGTNVTTLVNNGAFSHAVNSSVTPALPASMQQGDLILLIAAIRNSGTGTPNVPAGYSTILDMGNVKLMAKTHSGFELAPTVTFSGGAANEDTSAVMTSLRYTSISTFATMTQLNGSAQNIAGFPTTLAGPYGGGCCFMTVFWKQDDFTSVADPTGGTVVFSSSTTTGNDQGLGFTLEYGDGISTGQHSSQGFTITGGASAISRLGVAIFYGTQALTVTRAVNGVSKAQTAGTAVNVFNPLRLAL